MATSKKKMTAAAIAATALTAILAYSAFVLPASAQTPTASTSTTTSTSGPPPMGGPRAFPPGQAARPWGPLAGGHRYAQPWEQQATDLTVGQTITVSSTNGKYFTVGNPADNGTASGTVTLTVTAKLASGYTLSITQGNIVIGGTTYTISSGSAQMGPAAQTLSGQGATTPSGQFIVRATAHGSFAGNTATMSLDLSTGSTEYLVLLAGSLQG